MIEVGVLYGHPISHSLGYVGLIEKEWKNNKNIAEFFLAGVYSKEYSERESAHFNKVWNEIIKASPGPGKAAQLYYDDAKYN